MKYEKKILVNEIARLFSLLDDIDTASDLFKPEMNGFYKYTMSKAEKRFGIVRSDGYDLFIDGIKITDNKKDPDGLMAYNAGPEEVL